MLPKTGFLSIASDRLVAVLERMAKERRLEAGQILFEQGDTGDAFFVITEGRLEISVLSEDGRRLALDMMNAGDVLGEIALFDPGPRTAAAHAVEPVRLLELRNADLIAEIRHEPEIAIDLIHLAGRRMRWMNSQLADQVFLAMPARLARKLVHLTGEGGPTLKMSQSELAEFVGATREAVSKTLTGWRREGIVEVGRGGLTILDRAALMALAEVEEI